MMRRKSASTEKECSHFESDKSGFECASVGLRDFEQGLFSLLKLSFHVSKMRWGWEGTREQPLAQRIVVKV